MTTIHIHNGHVEVEPEAGKPAQLAPTAATVGFFDGVHRGHRQLVEQLRREAAACGLLSTVITFSRHPRQVMQPMWQPQLLSSPADRARQLAPLGIDQLATLGFDSQMAQLTARDFMQHVLQQQLNVRLLLTGYDNHFGHRTQGSTEGFDDYVDYGRQLGMEVVCGQPLLLPDGTPVSSSLVRRQLAQGQVEEAAWCLGRPYELSGMVVEGEQQGRQLGFPTANMWVTDSWRMIPANGVYAVRVGIDFGEHVWTGMTNIGRRPTFGPGRHTTIETHLFDFSADLYGRYISIEFMARLRDEQRFESPDALARQMAADAQEARRRLATGS